MYRIIAKLLLLLAPIFLLGALLVVVDPYNLINVSKIFSDETKLKCLNRTNATIPRGNILWRTIDYRRDPAPNILLGDSRASYVSNICLEDFFGGKAKNLAIPAGNYRTTIDLFWMAANTIELDNVIIQANFKNYNMHTDFDLYTPARQIIDQPYKYFFELNYLKDSFSVLYYTLTGSEKHVSRGFIHAKSNWEKSLAGINRWLGESEYVYPMPIYKDLKEISDYCDSNNINLCFLIAPNYSEVHSLIEGAPLSDDYQKFKQDIKDLGKTVDLDNKNSFSYNKDNYTDHIHVKIEIADTLMSLLDKEFVLSK